MAHDDDDKEKVYDNEEEDYMYTSKHLLRVRKCVFVSEQGIPHCQLYVALSQARNHIVMFFIKTISWTKC